MNKYKKLAFNTIVFAIGNFGSKILVLLLTRLYTKHISPPDMNTKDLLETIALFLLPIFTFSMTEAIIRYGLDKRYNKSEVFTTASCLTFIGLGMMVFIVPVLRFVPFLDFIPGYTIMLIVYTCTSAFRSLCAQFVRARGMVKLFSLDGIMATLSLFIFTMIFVAGFKWGVKGCMLAVILSDFCSAVFLFIVARLRDYLGIEFYSKPLARNMMRFALPLIPTVVMWTITGLSDRLFIRYMDSDRAVLGAGAAGLYGVANRIPNLISMVSTIFFQAWNMSAITENDSKDRSQFYEKIYSAYEAILFIASAGLILLVRPISAFFAHTGTYPAYKTVWMYTPVLVVAVLFTCLNQFLGSIYTATKHTNNSFWTSLAACSVNIVLNICLIPEWGIQGAAIATFLSYYFCFWLRIIDARYYVPFRFNAAKSLINTAALLIMSVCMITSPKLYLLWIILLFGFVVMSNYRSLLLTAKKLLKRG